MGKGVHGSSLDIEWEVNGILYEVEVLYYTRDHYEIEDIVTADGERLTDKEWDEVERELWDSARFHEKVFEEIANYEDYYFELNRPDK